MLLLDINPQILFLHLHSTLRWLALALVIASIIKSLIGLTGGSQYAKLDNIFAASFVGTMHLQLLIGLIMYFFTSPITEAALADFGAAMKNSELRFWAVEHGFAMIIAVVLAQVGRSKSKKKTEDKSKFKTQLIFFGIALLIMLWAIPWDRAFG